MKRFAVLSSILFLTSCGSPQITPIPSQAIESNTPQVQTESVSSRTVSTLVYKIMRRYDHNLNQTIDYRETQTFWKSLIGKNENERRQTRYSSHQKEVQFTVWNYSILFLASDTNKDGVATLDEIKTFLTDTYDKNKDGIFQTRGWWRFWRDPQEWEFFKREMREDVQTKRVPLHFKPPKNGAAEAKAAEMSSQNKTHITPLFLSDEELKQRQN